MKIIAFGASTSFNSINKALATYTANLVDGAEVEVLDLNDFPVPLFSEDTEKEVGRPDSAQAYFAKLESADAFVISFAEHNGTYTAAYKNLFDWASRINQQMFAHKPAVYLSTSPGPGGAQSVLAQAVGSAAFFHAEVKASVSVPSFYDVFDMENGEVTDTDIAKKLADAAASLKA
ncbi:NADPH-dependent FMN reductase [Vibrio algivorus]|uniref:FMN reductase n=1 Tax=Vibrio algivorus TaxID=1667024 RepID=A0A557P3T7_9VIBR|nr:NAD(P)H-dependent oxidoreductase [Vibrio algivorus]TVO35316.1 NAD(P)H-dependent oxidoreductase [Vibrio algivorus]GLT14156.1 FMN reductase [Vibrio algivorus]